MNYIDKIKTLGDTKRYTLEQLYEEVKFNGNLACFRVYCWRKRVEYKKNYSNKSLQLFEVEKSGYHFKDHTLIDIKQKLDYKGGLDGLSSMLTRNGFSFKAVEVRSSPYEIIKKLQLLNNTSNLTPKEIMDKLNLDVVNPSQWVKRANIPYKQRTKAKA